MGGWLESLRLRVRTDGKKLSIGRLCRMAHISTHTYAAMKAGEAVNVGSCYEVFRILCGALAGTEEERAGLREGFFRRLEEDHLRRISGQGV